ncbi:MAG: hypothetical protein A2189_01390 [Paenibacillus sp. RIFOXYA1_FULL_44_5]|nr:MAG: hypothetical protein A2189_01390 [Paenibacillus sp. RIFOXYA1_FULL_44_5]
MYINGQEISEDTHFQDHIEHQVPIQIYRNSQHKDIGYIEDYNGNFIKVNNTFYNRNQFTFISRPGY